MSRLPRVHVQKRPLMELGNRVCQGFDLLDLDEDFNASVVGVLAEGQERFGLRLHGGVVLKNHFHLLASPDDVQQQAAFMGFFTRQLSRLAGRRHGWEGSMFTRRYSSMEISTEDEAQVARLKYVLSNGCKEGLASSPLKWPGVPFAAAMIGDGVLKGVWTDRDGLYEARRRGEDVSEREFQEEVELVLSPLPCWAHMTSAQYRESVLGVIQEIERDTEAMHAVNGTRPAEALRLRQSRVRSSVFQARKLERRPCPWIYGRSLEVVRVLLDGLKERVAAYRAASELLRSGLRHVSFPENCFPPTLPFEPYASSVPGYPEMRPRRSG